MKEASEDTEYVLVVIVMEKAVTSHTKPGNKEPSWNRPQTEERVETIRVILDGGVSHEEDKQLKNRVGAGWILQIAVSIVNQLGS